MVLKTEPDRLVQPRIGVLSGSVLWKNWRLGKNGQKPETSDSTVKTANRSSWTGFGPVPFIPKLRRFYSFFLNLKPTFFIFSLHFSVLTPLLPFSLCLSVSHSHSHSHSHVLTSCFSRSHLRHLGLDLSLLRFLTSRSHFRRDLTTAAHSLDLSTSHLSSSRSHRRLSLLLVILPSPLACDLTATAHPRSLSPTDPAKGHSAPIKLSPSLSLSHSHSQILVYRLFFFFPIFSLWFGVYWVVGLLVWIVWNFDFYSSVFVVLLDWNFDWNLTIFVVLLGCWSAGVICKLVCIHLYMLCNLFDIWFYCKIVICMV